MRFLAVLIASLALCACGPFVYRIDVQQGNHVTEETVNPAKRAPWGIVNSVFWSLIFGYMMLIVLTLRLIGGGLDGSRSCWRGVR